MPSCSHCGQTNPDGNVFCGSCGTPLAAGTARSDGQTQQQRTASQSPRKLTPQADHPHYAPEKERRKRIEWIPWGHLTFGQKIGRLAVMLVVLGVVVLVGLRVINRIFDAMS
ncbi:MAG: zinc-ribbon domain-containing protein [Candidatus Binataceae bacterium]